MANLCVLLAPLIEGPTIATGQGGSPELYPRHPLPFLCLTFGLHGTQKSSGAVEQEGEAWGYK